VRLGEVRFGNFEWFDGDDVVVVEFCLKNCYDVEDGVAG